MIRRVLHIGCGRQGKADTTPGFNTPAWTEVRLDIDPAVAPDIIGTMLDMSAVATASMHGVFCSHALEHVYAHQVPHALAEIRRVLTPDGVLVLTCPDLQAVCALVAEDRLVEPAYTSGLGPISPLDMLYGLRSALAAGQEHMAHRCGFTETVLAHTARAAGFARIATLRRPAVFDLWLVASVAPLAPDAMTALARAHLPPVSARP